MQSRISRGYLAWGVLGAYSFIRSLSWLAPLDCMVSLGNHVLVPSPWTTWFCHHHLLPCLCLESLRNALLSWVHCTLCLLEAGESLPLGMGLYLGQGLLPGWAPCILVTAPGDFSNKMAAVWRPSTEVTVYFPIVHLLQFWVFLKLELWDACSFIHPYLGN